MSMQMIETQVRWQDLKVKSELDTVLEIAQQAGWKDCEVFGAGDMLTQPQQSMGWELIPADQYKYSIPAEAIARLHQVINAGVRVRGVIIADDQRHEQPAPPPAPPKPRIALPSVKLILSVIGKALLGIIHAIGAAISWVGRALLELTHIAGEIALLIGKALVGLMCVAAVIGLIWIAGSLLVHLWPLALFGLIGLLFAAGASSNYDPKLVILVDDGNGGTAWVSLFTWYD